MQPDRTLIGGPAATWIVGFVLLQIACQLALLLPMFSAIRVFVRTAAFGLSLALLVFLPGKGFAPPARPWVLASLTVVFLGLIHPTTNGLLSGGAQVAVYAATMGPLLWVGRLRPDSSVLFRVLLIFWLFHTTSACFGVLQVYYPGRFEPKVSTTVMAGGEMVEGLKISLVSGERVFRPMGLTDVPGGAASAGLYAFLFGLGFLLNRPSLVVSASALASMAAGLFCIYLSQTRSILVMAGVCALVYAVILVRRREWKRVLGVVTVVPAIVLISFVWAVALGGDSVTRRLNSLIEDRPDQVYYSNRGVFLETTITTLLPQYPLGAGLGRWGMMNFYFGDNSDPSRNSIWVEIQWTAWLIDGGIPLILAYATAVGVTCWAAWRIAISNRQGPLPVWAALILAYDVGAVAITFNYPIFMGQGGIEFWLLNSLLFAAAVRPPRESSDWSPDRV